MPDELCSQRDQEAHILYCELAEGSIGISRECSFRHGELLALKLDDLEWESANSKKSCPV